MFMLTWITGHSSCARVIFFVNLHKRMCLLSVFSAYIFRDVEATREEQEMHPQVNVYITYYEFL